MSYYTPGPPGAYQYGYPPATYAGAYTPGSYQYPSTAVTGYGSQWPYYYQPQQQQQTQRPSVARTTPAPTRTTSTSFATTHTPASYAARDTVNAASGGAGARVAAAGSKRQANLKGLFTKELRNLMYGFGDDKNPANDTVNVMEEILIEYIIDVCQSALAPTRKTRLSIEDIRRALDKPADSKKLARMEELLFMQEDIKRARAQFQESDMNPAGAFQG